MAVEYGHAAVQVLLVSYAAGSLGAAEHATVSRHLDGCATCRLALAGWSALGFAAQAAMPLQAPGQAALGDTRARLRPALPLYGPSAVAGLLRAQIPLVRGRLWAASALVMSLGLVTLLMGRGGAGLLSVLAPVVTAAGIAFIYGPEQDPALELALATPTSPRLVLLARLTLVIGYDFLLGLLVSVALAELGQEPGGVEQLVLQWLGPMLLLSAVSLWLSLSVGSLTATFVPLTLWVVKVALAGSVATGTLGAALLALLGTTNPYTLGLAAVIAVAVVAWLPRQERVACA